MTKTIRFLFLFTLATAAYHPTIAQFDSSSTSTFDLGRLSLQRELTQSITIKGEQLEKMPFTNLTEAINSWLMGAYTNATNIVYVIDGMVMNDPNAYSIHDIADITLIQNALGQINGSQANQQMVVINTRKGGPGKQGLTVAAQSFLSNRAKERSERSSTNFFHQLHVGAYQQHRTIQYGLSLNFLRDVLPDFKTQQISIQQPLYLNRMRGNAWAKVQLGDDNELLVQFNAIPQISGMRSEITLMNNVAYYREEKRKTTNLHPTLQWRSRILNNFYNTFKAGYLSGKITVDNIQYDINKPQEDRVESYSRSGTKYISVSDEIKYQAAFSNWHIEPAIQLAYRHLSYNTYFKNVRTNPGGIIPISFNMDEYKQSGNFFTLTPSVNLYYKDIFNVQGGALYNAAQNISAKSHKLFPFASASINVLKLAAPAQNTIGLQLFGSYAAMADNFGDLNRNVDQAMPVYIGPGSSPQYRQFSQIPVRSMEAWQAGAQLSLLKKRITIGYNHDQRTYPIIQTDYTPLPGFPVSSEYHIRTNIHMTNITAQIIDKKAFSWSASVTATSAKQKVIAINNVPTTSNPTVKFRRPWSGGFNSRFSWKRFSTGIDLLYYLNEEQIYTTTTGKRFNALTLQNAYAGYIVPIKGTKGIECYFAGRNLAQHYNTSYQIGGSQRFYGIGIKANM